MAKNADAKLKAFKSRVTVELIGETKNKFFQDVIKKDTTESKLARRIISDYYSSHMKF
mgnify:CR=1 FL=1